MEAQVPQAPTPMTHYEVALEYGRALTDPEHPMYRYRYTEKFDEWADALFARIPEGQRQRDSGDMVIGAPPNDPASDRTFRDEGRPARSTGSPPNEP